MKIQTPQKIFMDDSIIKRVSKTSPALVLEEIKIANVVNKGFSLFAAECVLLEWCLQ
jgi:hypothetical protein